MGSKDSARHKTFDEVIEQALKAAKCVVVLWSNKSALSEWVRTEASEGRRRGILIPTLIEDNVEIPLGFRLLHASRLMHWQGEVGHLEFDELRSAVSNLLGRPKGPTDSDEPRAASAFQESSPSRTRVIPPKASQDPWKGSKGKGEIEGNAKARRTRFLQLAGLLALFGAIAAVAFWRGTQPLKVEETERVIPEAVDPKVMWTPKENGSDVDWTQANEYCQNLRLNSFSDWRLPTIEELEKLYDPKGERGIRRPFRLTGWWVWSSTKKRSDATWYFDFSSGGRNPFPLVYSYNGRALCVRGSGE